MDEIRQIEIQRSFSNTDHAYGWCITTTGKHIVLSQVTVMELLKNPANSKHFNILNQVYDMLKVE